METFKPFRDRVLLKRIDSSSTTKSGFVVPDSAKEKPTECEVIAVSNGYINEFGTMLEPEVEIGDHVLIGKYSGSAEIKLDGVEYAVVRWDEILGVKESAVV